MDVPFSLVSKLVENFENITEFKGAELRLELINRRLVRTFLTRPDLIPDCLSEINKCYQAIIALTARVVEENLDSKE